MDLSSVDPSLAYPDEDVPSPSQPPADAGPSGLLGEVLSNPSAFGISKKLAEALRSSAVPNDDEDDAVARKTRFPKGEEHTAHIAAYRHASARAARARSLQGGINDIWEHLDGSPGCMLMGFDPAYVSGRVSMREDVVRIYEAMPYRPVSYDEFRGYFPRDYGAPDYVPPGETEYPYSLLPWHGWPSIIKSGHSPHLFQFRLGRAGALVTAQIAEAGGIDDQYGWIIDRTDFAFPPEHYVEWRRSIFMTDEERRAAEKAKRRAKDSTRKRGERQARKLSAPARPKLPRSPTAAKQALRPVEVTGDGHALVPLTQGYKARIVAADVPLVKGCNWAVRLAKGRAPAAIHTSTCPNGTKLVRRMHNVEGMSGPVEIIPPASAS